jgi:hypothetical protein
MAAAVIEIRKLPIANDPNTFANPGTGRSVVNSAPMIVMAAV